MFRLHRLGNLPHLGRGGGQAAGHKKNTPSLMGILLAAVRQAEVNDDQCSNSRYPTYRSSGGGR